MKNILLITMIAFIALNSCKKNQMENDIKNDAKFAKELRLSPKSIIIGTNNLILTTYLIRDFMPISEEN